MMDTTETLITTTIPVPLAHLTPSTTHVQAVRRARYNEQSLRELADSIRQSGVLQPILVRHAAASAFGHARYEIVAGERRWRAAEIAGLAQIDVIVRDLSDRDVLAAQLVENLQREGLDPLSEAEGYQELMQLSDVDADGVAKMIGRSRSYVYARTKLLDLIPAGREALARGDLDASRALLVARIRDEKAQEKALELALAMTWDGSRHVHSYRDLLREIGRRATVELKTATWALDDDTLPGGACTACPHRSGACPVPGVEEAEDTCQDALCFRNKARAMAKRKAAEAESSDLPVIKGEAAARMMMASGRITGHVDLDATCLDDECKAPEQPDTDDDEADARAWEEYTARRAAWKRRTYRQIFGEDAKPTAMLIHPKTGRAIEIMPIDTATLLLAQLGIIQTPQPSTPAAIDRADDDTWQEQQKKRAEALEKERAYRLRLAKELWGSLDTELDVDDLRDIACALAEHWLTRQYVPKVYGSNPNIRTLGERELGRYLRLCILADELQGDEKPGRLHAWAKRCGIEPRAFRKQFEAGELPDLILGATASPKPVAKKPAKKAAAKGKGKGAK
jgi:ParB/RepB/Spo0J family partition protein